MIVDYVCPFSGKLSLAIDSVLKPLFDTNGKYAGQVKIIFRNQVQPWHGSSTFVHEAGLAVSRVAPEKFWAFSLAVSVSRYLQGLAAARHTSYAPRITLFHMLTCCVAAF